jgi:hypothetical protein
MCLCLVMFTQKRNVYIPSSQRDAGGKSADSRPPKRVFGECYSSFVLLLDAPLTIREVMTQEEVPLADVFREVGRFLMGREDSVLFGAQAVNAYVETERMTQDVGVMSTDAEGLAEALRARLSNALRIAIRVRIVAPAVAYRVYQVRKPKNRHLVDVRQVKTLPAFRVIEGVRVVSPEELTAMKIVSMAARRGRPKELSDRLDVRRLLLALPDLKRDAGAVSDRLRSIGASTEALALWREIVREPVVADEDDEW